MTLRVGIIDDHPAIILGTTAILNAQSDIHVVATGSTAAELLAHRTRLDVILLDLVLADGSTPFQNVSALKPIGAHVLAFTSGDRPQLVRDAAAAGAIGMIRKSEEPSEIVEALRSALRGDVIASADWAAALDSHDEFVKSVLTKREAEVLALYASGETAEQVASMLFISRDTVLDHIRRIRIKYAAVDRAAPTKVDLYRRAIEDGLVQPNS